GNFADVGGDREGDRDQIVEVRFIASLADIAVIVVMYPLKAAKAFDHASAGEAKQKPIHDEQPRLGGIKKEIDRLVFRNVLLVGEGGGIDPEKRLIVRRADMR